MSRRRSCPESIYGARRNRYPASIWGGAVPISAPSARSSTCRGAKAGSLCGRSLTARARERRPRHQALLHHRRQFCPQPRLGELVDRLIELRGEGLNIGFTIQVDTLCHRIPNFIEKTTQAGVRRVFIGLENINPDNLLAAKKRQNKITEYRYMLQKWREHGATTYAGYIFGFPGDTKESILRDIEIIKQELPLDVLEFFFLTPLPGSEDHKVLLEKGA